MTTQEAYEKIREYFSRKGAVLAKFNEYEDAGYENPSYTCSYLDNNGNKCAVGCLIPDELYDSYFEGKSFINLLEVAPPELRELLNGNDDEGRKKTSFLRRAQDAHDDSKTGTVETFLFKLDIIATNTGLTLVR